MGEAKKDALRVDPDMSGLKLEFHGVKVTSDAGLLAYREIGGTIGAMSKGNITGTAAAAAIVATAYYTIPALIPELIPSLAGGLIKYSPF